VSREAYRIVQEGVTNALKHAAGEAVEVRLRITEGRLELQVSNGIGEGSGGTGGGRGLEGIAERVRLLGGEMSAGPDGSDRWEVLATMPLRPRGNAPVGGDAPMFTA